MNNIGTVELVHVQVVNARGTGHRSLMQYVRRSRVHWRCGSSHGRLTDGSGASLVIDYAGMLGSRREVGTFSG